MIKLRVEWRCECSGCGTELVTDFFDDSMDVVACPWCGCPADSPHNSCSDELRKFIDKSIREIEDKANGKIIIKR